MKTCLIVDESPVIRKIAARIVEQEGFAACPAENAEAALALIEAEGVPDVALVSASLCEPAGIELMRAIRKSEGGNRPLVLAAIVEANLGLLTRLKRAGADDIVYKPFNRGTLLAGLKSGAPAIRAA
ncbi:response regulator [Aurantimonas sp. Leaf443]|uniref:response regulator n=1 Tax=Aurantimonas sp. Leaf443 TaxID=1736378 RepID=UPI0006F2FD5C|nr:response regulator [Aurantimonas sp. Leaf443]KQT88165.1 hypothetical protein ASG48_01600 [Aurantimonas sp. Leaf443]